MPSTDRRRQRDCDSLDDRGPPVYDHLRKIAGGLGLDALEHKLASQDRPRPLGLPPLD